MKKVLTHSLTHSLGARRYHISNRGNVYLYLLLILGVVFACAIAAIIIFYHKGTKNIPEVKSSHISKSSHYINELSQVSFIPAHPEHYYCDLGQFYLQHQNYSEAINSFNKALEVEKEPLHRAEILYFLGCVYQLSNDNTCAKTAFDSAKQLCDKVIAEDKSEETKTKAKNLLSNITTKQTK